MAVPETPSFIQRDTPRYRRAVLALFCAGFATFALLYCVQPLLPQLAEAFGVSSASSSLALSLSTLGLAAGLLVSGALSESWGRKPVMVVALLLACGLGLATALVRDWYLLLVLRALLGIALSGLPALAMAYIGEEFDPASLPVAMGLYIGGTALGGLLGRLLTAVLSDLGGWTLALGGIAGLGMLACVLFVWLLPPSRHFQAQPLSPGVLLGNFARHLANADLRFLFLLSFLLMGSFVALFNYIGFYLSIPPFSLSSTWIGMLFMVYLLGIWSSGAAGRRVGRQGAGVVLQQALLLMLAGVLLCLLPWLVLMVAGLALFTTGFFAAHSVASGLVGQRAGQARAQASALYLCAYYLGSSVLGYVTGWIWQHWGWTPLILSLGLALLAALLIVRRL
ncbi:MAG: MFS transporter [Gammaproteobacteria bacterium]|nr:MFS transporter [Gammaproteobacteria bacterium]